MTLLKTIVPDVWFQTKGVLTHRFPLAHSVEGSNKALQVRN